MRRTGRRIVRYTQVAAHVAIAVAKVGTRWHRWDDHRRRRECEAWSRKALGIFGFETVVRGTPPERVSPASLIVANHSSWLDIYVLLAHVDAAFVAKKEVRRWPAIGWLADRLGTLFIDRERKQSLIAALDLMSSTMASGRAVGLFPEGTTSDGSIVLPFHPALFDVAIRTGRPVQPVAIRYVTPEGTPAREVAFIDEMTLIESFRRLADCRGYTAEITFLDPISPDGRSRATLARDAEAAIRAHLGLSQVGAAPVAVRIAA